MRGNFARSASCLLTLMISATVVLLPHGALAQEKSGVAAGKDTFLTHCAVCHGVKGNGKGPYADLLADKPADLTQIAKKNHGTFPSEWVARTIDGRDPLAAHGPWDMPIWGERFGQAEESGGKPATKAAVHARIQQLVAYLKSIQER